MNLYKIKTKHFSSKDSCEAIACLLLAEGDEDVYEWMKGCPDIGELLYISWDDNERDNEVFEIFNDDYDVIGTRTYKEKIVALKGDIDDEDVSYDDLYYGLTLFGWDLVCEDSDFDSELLRGAGILHSTKEIK